jgi:drug/metabolite transporter (DMT)-like permease
LSRSDIKTNFKPAAALLTVQLLFGSLPVIGKIVLDEVPATALVGIRVLLAATVLIAVQLYRKRIWLERRSDYLLLAVLGFFGVVLNQLLFIGGLSLTKAANTSLLVITIPIFTLLVGVMIGSERITPLKIAGVILAAAGAIILIDPRNASFSSSTTLGDSMIVLNSLAFGIYVATSKEVVTRNGAFRSMMWVFIFSSILSTPLALYSLFTTDITHVSNSTWLLSVYISIFATAIPYLLNAYAIVRVSPAAVAVFIYLQPLIGFILAAVFLGEEIGFRFILSALLIFAGVYFVSKRPSSNRPTAVT